MWSSPPHAVDVCGILPLEEFLACTCYMHVVRVLLSHWVCHLVNCTGLRYQSRNSGALSYH